MKNKHAYFASFSPHLALGGSQRAGAQPADAIFSLTRSTALNSTVRNQSCGAFRWRTCSKCIECQGPVVCCALDEPPHPPLSVRATVQHTISSGMWIVFGRQASSQSHSQWQWQWFLSVANTAPSSGDSIVLLMNQWPNGNAASCGLFGRRFEPRSGKYAAAAAAAKSGPTRIRTTDH